jgi:hypothetical protein
MKKPINEILSTVGAPVSTIENWLMPDRFQLTSTFEATTRGRARLFSRLNTLELSLIAAFRKAGAPASSAAALAAAVLRAQKARAPLREFWFFAAGDTTKGKEVDRLNIETLQSLLDVNATWPPVVTIVWVGEIVRRVDALFSGGQQ